MQPAKLDRTMLIDPRRIKHCRQCGTAVDYRVPDDDNRERAICGGCGTIHYENPINVVGTVPVWGEQVLLCKRAIEPRYGFWTLPAGFMENNETCGEAALRETREEAGARIELGPMFTFIDLPHISQIHIIYRARLLDLEFSPGEESLDAILLGEADIPWDDIAFRSIDYTLKCFFEDRRKGEFELHSTSFAIPSPGTYR